jgi:Na+-driven multidrug efflux pump
MFQAMVNSWAPLGSSSLRLLIFAAPAAFLSRLPGFSIQEVWYLSVATVAAQAVINLALLSREFKRKLRFSAQTSIAPAASPEIV